MTEDGAWALFFATGLPEAYLAARRAAGLREKGILRQEKAQAAFSPRPCAEQDS